MALGYFPAVIILLLLETAKITGIATTRARTSLPTISEPHPFPPMADTTSGTETTTPAVETNGYLSSSIALLSKTTSQWSTVGESPTTNYLGVTTTLPSSSLPDASIPAGTSDVSVASSSLAVTSISSTDFGGPPEEGTAHPAEPTMLFISFTTEEMSSSPRSPTSQDKMTSEGPSTVIFTTTWEESTSEKHLSFPPFTTETMKTSPMSVLLPSPTIATSTVLSATPVVEDTTGSSKVTTSSKAEITSWWPGSSHSSTSTYTVGEVNSNPHSPTSQDKGTSEGLLATISTTSQAETMSEKHPSSPSPQNKRTSEGPLTSTTEKVNSSPGSPTAQNKRTSEGLLTSTAKEMSSSPCPPTWFLLISTQVTSTPTSVISGVGDTTSSSGVTTGSEVEITNWRLGTSSSSTSSSVTQYRTTPKVTSTGLLSSKPGKSSLGLSAPSSTNPTSQYPATVFKVLSSTTTSPSASASLPKTPGEATTEITTLPPTSMPTSEPRPSTSVADTTGVMETIPPAEETTGSLPSSVASLSHMTSPWSTLGETSLHEGTKTLPSSSSPEASIPAGTQDVFPVSSSLAVTSTSNTGFGGPSEEGTIYPTESTMLFISSTVEEVNSSPRSPTAQSKRTSEGLLTSTAEEVNSSPRSPVPQNKRTSEGLLTSTAKEMGSSPGSPTPQNKRTPKGLLTSTAKEVNSSPGSPTAQNKRTPEGLLTSTAKEMSSSPCPPMWFLLTSTQVTSTPTSVISGVGDTTSSSGVTTGSEVEITSWRPGTSSSSTSSSVTQYRSTPKVTSTGLLSSKPGKSSLGLSAPSSTNPTSQYPATLFKVLSSTTTSPSASTGLPKTPAGTRFILSVRFSTQLNITDSSVTHAVRKWLDQELQAKFPVGSFNLTLIG